MKGEYYVEVVHNVFNTSGNEVKQQCHDIG